MYSTPIRSDELYHHGVKGMHWGIRRYQTADGILTAEGRKRVRAKQTQATKSKISNAVSNSKSSNKSSNADPWMKESIKQGKGKQDISAIEKTTRQASDAIGNAARATRQISDIQRKKAKKNTDLSQMSDEDLRKSINRANLERQYMQIQAEASPRAIDTVGDYLDVASSLAGIAVAGVTIASLVYNMKK